MHTQPLLTQLAQCLLDAREQITAQWVATVHRDQALEISDTLTLDQLKDHLPLLFEDLAEGLRTEGFHHAEPEQAEADDHAKTHGTHRWQQGYRLDEVLHELASLRGIFQEHLLRFFERHPETTVADRIAGNKVLHRFLDDAMCSSVAQFVNDQQTGLIARAELAEQGSRALATGNAALRQTDETRLRMLRTVAHELRNLLNATKLSGQMVAEEPDDRERRAAAAGLFRNVDHMSELLDDLLDLSTLQAGQTRLKMVRFDPCSVVEEICHTYEARAEAKGLRFSAKCDPALGPLVCDELKVKQIAGNLVSNALKYTVRGRVSLRVAPVDDARWHLVVEDTGVGIAPEEVEKIFAEFHRLPSAADEQGTGLGLAIVKRLVELLGGEVRVESRVGEGSRFEVLLPLRRE